MASFTVRCAACGAADPTTPSASRCAACGGVTEFVYDLSAVDLRRPLPGIWRFFDLLPLASPDDIVSLGEGSTPLIPARLGETLGVPGLAWKWEGANPTGSQKDRGLAVAIAAGKAMGATSAIIGSTGSAGLSSAAYAAQAGLRQAVLMTRGAPVERLVPMAMLGAELFEVDGTIEETFHLIARARDELGLYETTTYRAANPFQAEGAKTIGYEIAEQAGVPDWIVVPLGGGGTLAAIWRAFNELLALGRIDRLPRLCGVQPAAYNAIETAFARGYTTEAEIASIPFATDLPPTALVKLEHRYPHDGAEALAAIRASNGAALSATDEEAFAAQRRIGAREGLYVEPSSAVALVGVEKLLARGLIEPGQTVVGLLTGSGHRETHLLVERGGVTPTRIDAETGLESLAAALSAPAAVQEGTRD